MSLCISHHLQTKIIHKIGKSAKAARGENSFNLKFRSTDNSQKIFIHEARRRPNYSKKLNKPLRQPVRKIRLNHSCTTIQILNPKFHHLLLSHHTILVTFEQYSLTKRTLTSTGHLVQYRIIYKYQKKKKITKPI